MNAESHLQSWIIGYSYRKPCNDNDDGDGSGDFFSYARLISSQLSLSFQLTSTCYYCFEIEEKIMQKLEEQKLFMLRVTYDRLYRMATAATAQSALIVFHVACGCTQKTYYSDEVS